MDMETFVRECISCDVSDTEKVAELLAYGAELGTAILEAREKRNPERMKIPYEDVLNRYNDICVSLPKAHKLSQERKRHIKACFTQKFTLEDFEKAFRTVQNTPFLRGENDRGWHATFDWIIKPANLLKVIEGQYGPVSTKSEPSFDLKAVLERAINGTPTV